MLNSLDVTLRHVLTIGHFCVLITGIVLCITHRRLTGCVWLIAAGLIGRLTLEVLQLLFGMLYNPTTNPDFIRYWFFVISLLELGVWLVIVVGLGLSFRDIRDQMRLLIAMARRDT